MAAGNFLICAMANYCARFFSRYKTEVSSATIALVCFALFLFFPGDNLFRKIVITAAFLLALPIIFIKVILRRHLRDYGINFYFDKKALFLSLILGLILICALYVIIMYTGLIKGFSLADGVSGSFRSFLFYEILAVGFFTLVFEFFFRGFITIGLGSFLRHWAILAQFLLFLFLYALSGLNDWPLLLYAIAAPFSGFMAYRTKSLAYSFSLTYFFIIFADAILIFSQK